MQKFTAACLALVAVLFFVSVGCSVSSMSGRDGKHTGPVTVRKANGRGFEFVRPNGEFFEMSFDPIYLGPQIRQGDVLSDLTYTDQKNHQQFFVKATLVSEHPPEPVADKTLYDAQYAGWVCSSENECTVPSPLGRPFYLWKDGGYHDKPELTKGKK